LAMKAGELCNRIIFQRKTVTYGTRNEEIPAWVDGTPIFAKIQTTGGGEFYAAQKLNAQTTALFTVRYNATINPTMRIKHGNRIYEILSINDVDAKHVEQQISGKAVT